MFLIIMPVIVPFFNSLGLNMHEIYQLQALFGIAVMAFEIPTGYLCDLWGRKYTLVIGSTLSGLGFSYLVFAKSFTALAFFEIIVALGTSFISGSDVSLLYDSVESTERKHSTHSLANMQLATLGGESLAAIFGGLLAIYSFTHVTIANAIVSWLPLLIALTLHEPKYVNMDITTHRKNFRRVFDHIFFHKDKILPLIFFNSVIWSLSSFFAVWLFQKYWEINGVTLVYFGIIWSIYNLTTGIVGKYVHFLETKFGPIPMLVFISIAPIFAYFGMAGTTGYLGVGLGLLFYLARGIKGVLLRDALNWRTPSEFRATTNSLESFFFRLGFAVFGPGVGYLIDQRGLNFALNTLGVTFTVLFFVTMLPFIRHVRRISPDYIPSR